MPFHGSNKMYSLWVLPIIIQVAGQQKDHAQLNPQWLWGGGITISLLLSAASLGLTLIQIRKLKRYTRESISTLKNRFKKSLDFIVVERLESLEKQVADLKTELISRDNNIQNLISKTDSFDRQLSVLRLPDRPSGSAYLSTQSITEGVKPIASLASDSQSAESMSLSPVQSEPRMPMGSDQALISWQMNMTANSKIDNFAAAIEMNHGNIIREQADSELNITNESEDALVRREAGHKTKLEEVNGGGSYYRLSDGDRHWLFPTSLTLRTIAKYQPSKGLFRYELEPVTTPSIKQPAEIRAASGNCWQVIEMGTIIIPQQ